MLRSSHDYIHSSFKSHLFFKLVLVDFIILLTDIDAVELLAYSLNCVLWVDFISTNNIIWQTSDCLIQDIKLCLIYDIEWLSVKFIISSIVICNILSIVFWRVVQLNRWPYCNILAFILVTSWGQILIRFFLRVFNDVW